MFKGFSKKFGFSGIPTISQDQINDSYGFSDCLLWLDAGYGLNTSVDGAAVSSWASKVGSNIAIQNTAANQGTLTLSSATFNNNPCINFTATSKTYKLNEKVTTSVNTIIAVVLIADDISYNKNLFMLDSGNSTANQLNLSTPINQGIGIFNNTASVINTTTRDTTKHICIFKAGSSGEAAILLDGAVGATGTWTPTVSYDTISFNDVNNYFNGRLAELLIFNNGLSIDDCLELSSLLNSKYAIY